jgi:hypothetical protein
MHSSEVDVPNHIGVASDRRATTPHWCDKRATKTSMGRKCKLQFAHFRLGRACVAVALLVLVTAVVIFLLARGLPSAVCSNADMERRVRDIQESSTNEGTVREQTFAVFAHSASSQDQSSNENTELPTATLQLISTQTPGGAGPGLIDITIVAVTTSSLIDFARNWLCSISALTPRWGGSVEVIMVALAAGVCKALDPDMNALAGVARCIQAAVSRARKISDGVIISSSSTGRITGRQDAVMYMSKAYRQSTRQKLLEWSLALHDVPDGRWMLFTDVDVV